MIISAILRERNRRKDLEELRKAVKGGREEGRLEGRQEVQALWETWNRRRLEAERHGERFNETPPDVAGGNGLNGEKEN
ncbi:MAG: hypothetical protein F4X65_10535 [Chloroflexi bacterium]|nr:hypothetical protein [Chloroflexota bacterium]